MQPIRYQLTWTIISFVCILLSSSNFAWAYNANAMQWKNDVKEDNAAFKAIETVAKGNTTFAVELYAQLAKANSGNLFFSPYSISTALAMTYAGAKGKTETQMAQVLHFPAHQTKLYQTFALLQKQVVRQRMEIKAVDAN